MSTIRPRPEYVLLVAVLLLMAGSFAETLADEPQAAAMDRATQAPAPPRHPVWIKLEGVIDDQRRMYLRRRLEAAKSRGADLVILEIDSPGGTLEDSTRLADYVLEQRDLYVVAYIPREAISGGAILALSCNEIVMGENARIGDAGIIRLNPLLRTIELDQASPKFNSYLDTVRRYAEARNRPPALAEAMVKDDFEVFHVQDGKGNDWYMSEEEFVRQKAQGWEKVSPEPIFEARKDHFLTITSGQRAKDLLLAEAVVDGPGEVQKRYNIGRLDRLQEENWADSLVYYLNQWWVVGLLFLVGLVALYVELNAPGIGAGAAVALICFALYFWSHWAAGTADVLDILLFVLGVVLIALELFVIPGTGVAGILGLLLILASLILASQRVMIPSADDADEYLVNLRNTVGAMVFAGTVFFGMAYFLRRQVSSGGRLLGRFILTPPEPAPATQPAGDGQSAAAPGGSAHPPLAGAGTAVTALRPAGKARFGDQYVDVVAAEGEFIDAGQAVEVVESHGNVVVVRPASN